MADNAYVWVWLPKANEPVVAGIIRRDDHTGGDRPSYTFQYGRSYLARDGAIPLFSELPLGSDIQEPSYGLDIAGVLLDSTPDSWGRRVVDEKVFGHRTRDSEPAHLDLLTYMLESGSDRIGALDFQASPTDYVPRGADGHPSIEQLLAAADLIEEGRPLPASLADALFLGTSVGGARPKALVHDGHRRLIAKFPSTTDTIPVVQHEAVAMDLARQVGLDVAHTEIVPVAGRNVLLVERFDRGTAGTRRMQVSAATILGINPDNSRAAASYPALADKIRTSFVASDATLRELFGRIVFNIIVRNTDDHARNHAAFWDGTALTLTPAYDIAPARGRRDSVASHPMALTADGDNRSQLSVAVNAASAFHLTSVDAQDIIDYQVDIVGREFNDSADRARLTNRQRDNLIGSTILNPAIFWDA